MTTKQHLDSLGIENFSASNARHLYDAKHRPQRSDRVISTADYYKRFGDGAPKSGNVLKLGGRILIHADGSFGGEVIVRYEEF